MERKTMTGLGRAIGRRLKVARYSVGARNMTELSARMGLSGPNVWANWENRGGIPNAAIISAFVDFYPELSMDYIYRGEMGRLSYDAVQAIKAAEQEINEESSKPKRGRPRKPTPI